MWANGWCFFLLLFWLISEWMLPRRSYDVKILRHLFNWFNVCVHVCMKMISMLQKVMLWFSADHLHIIHVLIPKWMYAQPFLFFVYIQLFVSTPPFPCKILRIHEVCYSDFIITSYSSKMLCCSFIFYTPREPQEKNCSWRGNNLLLRVERKNLP